MAFIFTFEHPQALAIAAGLGLLTAAITFLRKPAASRLTRTLTALGLLLLILAAGGLTILYSSRDRVAVMVDLSPSTRSAEFRDGAKLKARISQLLGGTPYRLKFFSDRIYAADSSQSPLPDLPSEHTVFSPPGGTPVILFSDGQLELPAFTPSSFVVVDPGLQSIVDASVEQIEANGDRIFITVANSGSPRRLDLSGVKGDRSIVITAPAVLTYQLDPAASSVSARFAPGDAWPENDSLTLIPTPPQQLERWWIGNSPPAGWRSFMPDTLPLEASTYLRASAIVLNNVDADQLGEMQQDRLIQYVRDLGGALMILGGDHAFAAGNYTGSSLETLSPLSSRPPDPATHWIFLADSSGSMSGQANGKTRWQFAADAIARTIPNLPPHDLVSIASFSDTLKWLVRGEPAARAAGSLSGLPDVAPRGPTNLQQALSELTRTSQAALPTQLLVLTDADAELEDAALGDQMKERRIGLHVLALSDEGRALAALRRLAAATGGEVMMQSLPQKWTQDVRRLMQAALPDLLHRKPIRLGFLDALSDLSGRDVPLWNRTWLKQSASPLAEAREDNQTIVMAAMWNVGEGRVLAVAFPPRPDETIAFVDLIAQPPADPRFRISWQNGAKLKVIVDAVDDDQYLNNLALTLQLRPALTSQPSIHAIPQIGPGRYELVLDFLRAPAIAVVELQGRALKRFAVEGRYPPEFENLGNNVQIMQELAERSGGKIIEPTLTGPISFNLPPRQFALTQYLIMTAAVLIAAGLICWRTGR